MFAAAIRIDRLLETQIRRTIGRNHPSRQLVPDRGAQNWQFFIPVPAIGNRFTGQSFKPMGRVRHRRPAPALIFCNGNDLIHAIGLEHNRNIAKPQLAAN